MTSEFIPYEQALALKELGFDGSCFGYFYTEDKFFDTKVKNSELDEECSIAVPLYQQAFRWFREKYGYDVSIKKCTPKEYKFEIEQLFVKDDNYYFIDFVFKTYEEAELACLIKLIELCKKN